MPYGTGPLIQIALVRATQWQSSLIGVVLVPARTRDRRTTRRRRDPFALAYDPPPVASETGERARGRGPVTPSRHGATFVRIPTVALA